MVKDFIVTQLKKKQLSENPQVKQLAAAASPPPQTVMLCSSVKGVCVWMLSDLFFQICSDSEYQSRRRKDTSVSQMSMREPKRRL